MDYCDRKRLLMVMTSACACAAFGLLCIGVATDYWLFTREKHGEGLDGKNITYKEYWSGLFRKCKLTGTYINVVKCSHINDFFFLFSVLVRYAVVHLSLCTTFITSNMDRLKYCGGTAYKSSGHMVNDSCTIIDPENAF